MADPRFRLTSAGAQALADGANGEIDGLEFTALLLGDGGGALVPGGAGDDGRGDLRNRRERLGVTSSAPDANTVALSAVAAAGLAYSVDEAGIMARTAPDQAEFLFAYWTDSGETWLARVASEAAILGCSIAVEAGGGTGAITVAPALSFPGTVGPATTTEKGIVELATDDEAIAGMDNSRAVTPAALQAVLEEWERKLTRETVLFKGNQNVTQKVEIDLSASLDGFHAFRVIGKVGGGLGLSRGASDPVSAAANTMPANNENAANLYPGGGTTVGDPWTYRAGTSRESLVFGPSTGATIDLIIGIKYATA